MATTVSEMNSNIQQFPFSIESFTYSWCINLNPPSLESLSNSLRFSLDHTLSDYFDIDFLHLLENPDNSDHRHHHPPQAGTLEVEPRGTLGESNQTSSSVLRRCRSFFSKKILFKRYMGLFLIMPICRRIMRGRRSKVDAIDDHSFNGVNNGRSSSCDSETSIHGAVLHCKRSIGK